MTGNPAPSDSGNWKPAPPSKPGTGNYDRSAAVEMHKEESRQSYTKGQEPSPTWVEPKTGTSRPIDPRDQTIDTLRRELDQERWAKRQSRQRDFYRGYTSRPVVVYQDPYSSMFWWWLLDQSLDQRAMWAYHHQNRMDQVRYRDLLTKDAQLERRVKELEGQGVARDPNYKVPGMDPDLMYSDQYVDAVYNPQPTATETLPLRNTGRSAFGSAVRTLAIILAILAGLIFVAWLVFFKRWGAVS